MTTTGGLDLHPALLRATLQIPGVASPMSSALVPVPVPGADDLMAQEADGHVFVALKPMCDSLEISFQAQLRKLQRRSWAGVAQKAIPSPGGVQQTAVITSDAVPMWLATIDENKVSPQARPKLIAYQREARDALDAYFNKRVAAAPVVNQFDMLRAAIDQIEAADRKATEAKQIAERTEARLDGIEGNHGWLTALAYSKNNKLDTSETATRALGKTAARLARQYSIVPEKAQHRHFGEVNAFPAWIWDEAAEEFRAGESDDQAQHDDDRLAP